MRVEMKLDGIDILVGALEKSSYEKALNRTIRRMGQRFKTKSVKEIRNTYNIKAKKLNQYISTKTKHSEVNAEWRLYASSRPLSLLHFGARQTKKGVSVKVRKNRGRRVIKGAFLARGKGGNLRVFKRAGKERLPLESKHTLSVPQMFNKEILAKSKREIEANFEKEFKQNINYYFGRLK